MESSELERSRFGASLGLADPGALVYGPSEADGDTVDDGHERESIRTGRSRRGKGLVQPPTGKADSGRATTGVNRYFHSLGAARVADVADPLSVGHG